MTIETIDEAIAYEREKAKLHRDSIVPKDRYNNMPWIDSANKSHTYYAEQHEQRAEWLEELKELRKIKEDYSKGMQTSYATFMYNKAIDDFVTNVKDVLITDYSVFNTDDIRIFIDIIEEIAEQLKAGVENE